MTFDGILSVNFDFKGPFTQAIFVSKLKAIFVAPKLHQVSNMFETCKLAAISWRFYRHNIAGDFMQLRRDKNSIELRNKNPRPV